jgi:hypothetical protein
VVFPVVDLAPADAQSATVPEFSSGDAPAHAVAGFVAGVAEIQFSASWLQLLIPLYVEVPRFAAVFKLVICTRRFVFGVGSGTRSAYG